MTAADIVILTASCVTISASIVALAALLLLHRRPRGQSRPASKYWRWPPYFRCWACAAPHPDCTCGAYVCENHDECLAWRAEHAYTDTPEELARVRPLLGLPPRA